MEDRESKMMPIAAIHLPASDEEGELIQAARHDPLQFKPLYTRWVTRVYKYLIHRVQNRAAAEDLTSQVFLKVIEQLPRYHHNGHFAAWLFTITRNTANDYFRNLGREAQNSLSEPVMVESDLLDQAIQHDELRKLKALIRKLTGEEQELIRLRYAAGLTFREIGLLTFRSEDAARKALARLLDRLHDQMDASHE
jgi:RNA polymerase sigma-70 factor, ECF subfamily